jgi:hypothetical protein
MSSQENEEKNKNELSYDNHVFQILEVNKKLILDKNEQKNNEIPEQTGMKIVAGTLSSIREKYDKYDKVSFHLRSPGDTGDFYLPSPGAEPNTLFPGKGGNYLWAPEYATVRFLLQCRNLSQLMTKTWLDESKTKCQYLNDEQKEEQKIIRYMKKIFKLFNYKPQIELLSDLTFDELEKGKYKNDTNDTLKENVKNFGYYLYDKNALPLELFLSGQAYILDEYDEKVDDRKGTLQRLNEPIFSTYELIWEYELDLSWDSYYAKRVDIARPGYRDIIPHPNTRVTLGLPARPGEDLLTNEQIKEWVNATEKSEDETKFPFYPETDTTEWKNKQVKNVFPPYPYMILSCS